ncbi:MAG: ABC transporter ATP-binding protein [Clostridiaceae bacterium]|nr:ABC transporter ATP-binding protein [Clostridiaceae bacterium]
MSIIKLENITKIYGKKDNEVRALSNVSLSIEKGEIVAVVGPSGSGKSTLLNIIGCIDSPTEGSYWLDNSLIKNSKQKDMARIRNERFGFVVQDFALVERYTVKKNVLIPLSYSSKKISKNRADELLERLGLSEKKNVLASDLSGGQRQRVAIARALINDPDIILADEPTGALDKNTGFEVMKILTELNEEGKTIIVVTHNSRVAEMCSRVITIEDGMIRNT